MLPHSDDGKRPHAGGRDRVRNGHRHTDGDRIRESRGVCREDGNPRGGFDESRAERDGAGASRAKMEAERSVRACRRGVRAEREDGR